MQVRRMLESDTEEVSLIEKEIFSMPWSQKSFSDALKREGNIYLVAENEKEILGYAGMWTVMGEGEITNVAVKPAARRQGVADAIMENIIMEGRRNGTGIFFLEVRQSNEAAMKLYEKHGFSQIGIRKNFYEKPVENAIVMSRTFY